MLVQGHMSARRDKCEKISKYTFWRTKASKQQQSGGQTEAHHDRRCDKDKSCLTSADQLSWSELQTVIQQDI